MMKNILVTGGAGFIGSWVAQRFIDEGHNVVVVDNLSTGFQANVPADAKFYELDIRSKALRKLVADLDIEIISHLAAQINLRKSIEDVRYDIDVNVNGTINLLEAAVENDIKKFIFSSTGGALYGEQERAPATEEYPVRPLSPYGINKAVIEHYLYYYYKVHRLPYISLRYSNVYGPRQNPFGEAGVIAVFCYNMLKDSPVYINGDGRQTRDFVFVDDVVEANWRAINSPEVGPYNIATAKETDIITIFDILKDIIGFDRTPEFRPAIDGEQQRSVLSFQKAAKELDWHPEYSFKEGLIKTVEYFKQCERAKNDSR